jgi:hypothetical protein
MKACILKTFCAFTVVCCSAKAHAISTGNPSSKQF